jgi:hypothetical protein
VKVDPKFGGQWKVPSLVANGGSKLGGQWNVPSSVANGRFQAWWAMEGSKLGGQWKVPSLVGNGRFQAWWAMEGSKLGDQWKVKEKHFFTSSHFPPNNFTKTFNLFFPFTLRFYSTTVVGRYSCISFPFCNL